EGNSEAARRPSELPRQGEIAREQHGCSSGNGAPAGEKRARGAKARDEQDRNGKNQDGEEHYKRRAMRGRGEGDEQKEPNSFQGCENRTMKDQEMERKHAQPGEDVGQQGAGQDGQGGDEREAGDHQGSVPGPAANPAARNTSDTTQMAQPVCRTSSG